MEHLTRHPTNTDFQTWETSAAFVVWRVGDALTFSQALGSEGGAERKLDGLLTKAAIGTLGGHDLAALVSTTRQAICRWIRLSRSCWRLRRLWRCTTTLGSGRRGAE